jgi:hypothetical protein
VVANCPVEVVLKILTEPLNKPIPAAEFWYVEYRYGTGILLETINAVLIQTDRPVGLIGRLN